jgi:hypothetical protein
LVKVYGWDLKTVYQQDIDDVSTFSDALEETEKEQAAEPDEPVMNFADYVKSGQARKEGIV